ncbi:MAG: pyruvate formate lyase-activating protein [Clostridia bacterium]|nr:pyruvate formate lyase-activating protein [Clostridia bacterium]
MQGHIHSIESFGTVDGPGVRFVVFFQGCPMRCLYCHNPDTWNASLGQSYEAIEIISKMERNLPFYKTGGITATGGEPLCQIDFLIDLFSLAKAKNIHTCLDTSGILFDRRNEMLLKKFDKLVSLCDLVMLDIKHIDSDMHKRLTSCSNENVLDFAKYLNEKGVKTRIRYVLVPSYTDDEDALKGLGKFLKGFSSIEKIEVLPYHNLGQVKYEGLGIDYPLKDCNIPTDKDVKRAFDIIYSSMK